MITQVRIRDFSKGGVGPYETFFFFLIFFVAIHSRILFWGPCFGFLVTSPLGFKTRMGSALFALWRRNFADIRQQSCIGEENSGHKIGPGGGGSGRSPDLHLALHRLTEKSTQAKPYT